jgi:hypothetical protein
MSYLTKEFLEGMSNQVEEEMLEGLMNEFKSMYPKRCRVLGDKNLNLFLTHQQKRAKHYNYLYYDDLKRYAIIAFYLGTYFDEDELYPWVKDILVSEESFGRKVDILNKKFYVYFDTTIGKDAVYFQEALKKLQNINKNTISKFRQFEEIVDILNYIYPQRMKLIGKERFLQSVVNQKHEVEQFDIRNALGSSIYATFVFLMGSHVYNDPLFAWVKKYLDKPLDKSEKIDILYNKGLDRARKEAMNIEKILRKKSK